MSLAFSALHITHLRRKDANNKTQFGYTKTMNSMHCCNAACASVVVVAVTVTVTHFEWPTIVIITFRIAFFFIEMSNDIGAAHRRTDEILIEKLFLITFNSGLLLHAYHTYSYCNYTIKGILYWNCIKNYFPFGVVLVSVFLISFRKPNKSSSSRWTVCMKMYVKMKRKKTKKRFKICRN